MKASETLNVIYRRTWMFVKLMLKNIAIAGIVAIGAPARRAGATA